MNIFTKLALITTGFATLSACQTSIPLMPTPEILTDERFDLFEENPAALRSNQIVTLYATTRKPARRGYYSGGVGNKITLGRATLQIGEADTDLESLHEQSTSDAREEVLTWRMVDAVDLGSTPRPDRSEAGIEAPADALRQAIEALNADISSRAVPELTIFIHGAKQSFESSLAQAAQFQFFTGDNAPVIAFTWPSPNSYMAYSVDRYQAERAARDLGLLIEQLARYSVAEKIHLLGYSVGGRIIGDTLALLAEDNEDPESLRIGQVYLAQSDQSFKEFITQLPVFFPIVDGLTVTYAAGDPVLMLARFTDGVLRVGAAGEDSEQALNLTEAELDELVSVFNSERATFINLREVDYEGYAFSHGAWHDNPWVSTDVLVTILVGLKGSERGLEPTIDPEDGVRIWGFPDDYVARLTDSLLSRADDQ